MRAVPERRTVAYLACLALAVVCCACACGSGPAGSADGAGQRGAVITVGSFDFPESVLLADIYAGALPQAQAQHTIASATQATYATVRRSGSDLITFRAGREEKVAPHVPGAWDPASPGGAPPERRRRPAGTTPAPALVRAGSGAVGCRSHISPVLQGPPAQPAG